MKQIYLVIGSTGIDDDHREWPVRAFDTKEEAKEYKTRCEILAYEHLKTGKSVYNFKSELDPDASIDHRLQYFIKWVPFGKLEKAVKKVEGFK